MFEILYRTQQAVRRHRHGPFVEERERYLRHCAAVGGTLDSQRVRGRSLLWVAGNMSASDRDGVDRSRLHQIVYENPETPPAPGTAQTVINFARPWLIFLGWWREQKAQVPFEDHLNRFVIWMRDERGLTTSTVEQWRSRVATFLTWCGRTGRDFHSLRPADVDEYFITHGAERWCRVSAGHVATMLRVFLRHAATTGACDRRLADAIQSPRVYQHESLPCALGWPDVRRLLASTETDTPHDIRDRAALMLLALYGLRRGEVASLRLDQIDWKGRRLLVGRLKRRQPQIYPLLQSVAEALARYIDTVRPTIPEPQVFIRLKAPHRPITPACLYSVVSRRLDTLKIKASRRGPHLLRHACAGRLLAEGLTFKEIGDHLGHRSTSSTAIYAKVDLVALREVGDFDLGALP